MQIHINVSDNTFIALVRESSTCSNDLISWDVLEMKILSSPHRWAQKGLLCH